MDATDKDMVTILKASFQKYAIDPSQPGQWSVAGEVAVLEAMRHAYNIGMNDGTTLAAIIER